MKPACPKCGAIHGGDWTVALGRFRPGGVEAYRAAYDGSPVRGSRVEAERDMCRREAARRAAEVES